jgi:hypothetical protein
MSAQVSESLAKSFRVDAESLKNVDALVEEKWPDALQRNPKALEYEVIRRDSLTFPTNDIDDILREDNDRATRIQSILIKLSDPDFVEMHILFSENGIDITANAADRAQLGSEAQRRG